MTRIKCTEKISVNITPSYLLDQLVRSVMMLMQCFSGYLGCAVSKVIWNFWHAQLLVETHYFPFCDRDFAGTSFQIMHRMKMMEDLNGLIIQTHKDYTHAFCVCVNIEFTCFKLDDSRAY